MNPVPQTISLDKRCVACGEPIELSERGLPNHHCSERFEAAVTAAERRAANQQVLLTEMPAWLRRIKETTAPKKAAVSTKRSSAA